MLTYPWLIEFKCIGRNDIGIYVDAKDIYQAAHLAEEKFKNTYGNEFFIVYYINGITRLY